MEMLLSVGGLSVVFIVLGMPVVLAGSPIFLVSTLFAFNFGQFMAPREPAKRQRILHIGIFIGAVFGAAFGLYVYVFYLFDIVWNIKMVVADFVLNLFGRLAIF